LSSSVPVTTISCNACPPSSDKTTSILEPVAALSTTLANVMLAKTIVAPSFYFYFVSTVNIGRNTVIWFLFDDVNLEALSPELSTRNFFFVQRKLTFSSKIIV
jgi:hypothetical protein